MSRIALLPLVIILAACASDPFGIPDDRVVNDCEHGGVEVRLGLTGARGGMERTEDRLTFNVEVANNLRQDIVVKNIRIDPTPDEMAAYQLDSTARSFNETIPENGDHLFELPARGRVQFVDPRRTSVGSDSLQVVVTVSLESGDSYRCAFGVPTPAF